MVGCGLPQPMNFKWNSIFKCTISAPGSNQTLGSSHGGQTSPARCLTKYPLETATSLPFIKHALQNTKEQKENRSSEARCLRQTETGWEGGCWGQGRGRGTGTGQSLDCRQEKVSEYMTGNSWPISTSSIREPSGRTGFTSCSFFGNKNPILLQKPQFQVFVARWIPPGKIVGYFLLGLCIYIVCLPSASK